MFNRQKTFSRKFLYFSGEIWRNGFKEILKFYIFVWQMFTVNHEILWLEYRQSYFIPSCFSIGNRIGILFKYRADQAERIPWAQEDETLAEMSGIERKLSSFDQKRLNRPALQNKPLQVIYRVYCKQFNVAPLCLVTSYRFTVYYEMNPSPFPLISICNRYSRLFQ